MAASFAVIGGGWRTAFFLRAARALPERFELKGVVFRTAAKAPAYEKEWGVKTFRDLDALVAAAGKPDFVVVAVRWAPTPDVIADCVERGLPVLSETPPGPDEAGLARVCALAKKGRIQVAEQYPFQPLHAARLALIRSGRLGEISQAQVSAAHGYHGLALIRQALGAGREPVELRAANFTSPLVQAPGKHGLPPAGIVEDSHQVLAWLKFGERLGVLDFTGDQYHSWIRSNRFLVRGERGEINGHEVRCLGEYPAVANFRLERRDAGEEGNLEGLFHRGYQGAGEWLYRNPFAPAELADDDLAVADCLERMGQYAAGGPGFYDAAEAAWDHCLNLAINRAAKSGETVRAEPPDWLA